MTTPTALPLSVQALLKAAFDQCDAANATAITGLTGSARALFTAVTARREMVSVLVVSTDAEVESLTSDTRFFFASLEGLLPSDAERAVLPFPSLEVDPYCGLAPHFEVASARAGVLCALVRREVRIVVASAAALLPRVTSPPAMRKASAVLTLGDESSPTLLGDRLLLAGFVRQDPVDAHGEFCVRGGIVDFFTAGDDHPVRLEFVGDNVESIRRYDEATQRSIGVIDHVAVTPVRERLEAADGANTPEALASVFEYLPTSRVRLLASEPEEIAAQLTTAFERLTAAFEGARARGEDIVIIDTAGRMQNKTNLMEELRKVHRVTQPHLVIFVADALAGNDAVRQAIEFQRMLSFDGAALCKLDTDAKGGAALSIAHATGRPIVLAGVGQGYDDLIDFDPAWFIDTILE